MFSRKNFRILNLLKCNVKSTNHKTPNFWRKFLSIFSVVVYIALSSITIYLILLFSIFNQVTTAIHWNTVLNIWISIYTYILQLKADAMRQRSNDQNIHFISLLNDSTWIKMNLNSMADKIHHYVVNDRGAIEGNWPSISIHQFFRDRHGTQ